MVLFPVDPHSFIHFLFVMRGLLFWVTFVIQTPHNYHSGLCLFVSSLRILDWGTDTTPTGICSRHGAIANNVITHFYFQRLIIA